jgi:hypothetical protein
MFSTSASQVSSEANYIESVFSTYLYTGNSSTQTITNGIDLSTNGGLVWMKDRSTSFSNNLYDTARGATKAIFSNLTDAQNTIATGLTAFNTNGFSIGSSAAINTSPDNLVSWTFRKQAKFFDVVTYTGTGANTTIAHNLGSVPGCIIVKCVSAANQDWAVYHRSLGANKVIWLNQTTDATVNTVFWNNTAPTSSVFSVGTAQDTNGSGKTYVAYLFAHDAGGFGLTGTDNVISCGIYNGNSSSPPTVTLGWEPQLVMVKMASYGLAAGSWHIFDTMRGMSNTSPWKNLSPNTSAAESDYGAGVIPTATGFKLYGNDFEINTSDGAAATYIYIAIRRGPMKVPTSGTSVFQPVTYAGNDTYPRNVSTTITPDLCISRARFSTGTNPHDNFFVDRLRGGAPTLASNLTSAEDSPNGFYFDVQNGIRLVSVTSAKHNNSADNYINWSFRRAPGFFDEVCYTGTGSATTVAHNLGAVPELMIVKRRETTSSWIVYNPTIGAGNCLFFNANSPSSAAATSWNSTAPTSSVFSVGTAIGTNASGGTYVAYLFATCAGVSKVGSYTGTGATQTIDCGFTGGARFVLIKRTDTTGDWYVWDTARGMVSGTDPSLLLNSTAAEVNANSVYTTGVGFQIVSTAADINASGGSYIFLAIA